MVGHQVPSQQFHASIAQILPHQSHISEAVLIHGKGLAPIHSALRDVAGNPRQYTSVSSRHSEILLAFSPDKIIAQFRLTPFPPNSPHNRAGTATPPPGTTVRIGGSTPQDEGRESGNESGKESAKRKRPAVGAAVLAGIGKPKPAAKKKNPGLKPRQNQSTCPGPLTRSSICALAGCKTQTAGIRGGGLNLGRWLLHPCPPNLNYLGFVPPHAQRFSTFFSSSGDFIPFWRTATSLILVGSIL